MKMQHVFRVLVAGVVLMWAFAVPTARCADEATKAKVAPLETVIKALMDVGVTDLQKQELVGKIYEGVLKVNEVTSTGEGKDRKIVITVDVGQNAGDIPKMIKLNTKDRDKAMQLRKGDQIRITGRLGSITREVRLRYVDVEWATFEDVSILEIATPGQGSPKN